MSPGAEGTRRIAIEGAEAQGVLALVRGVEQHVARLVLKGHEEHRADAGLDVLLREIELDAPDDGIHRFEDLGVDIRNGDHVVGDAEPPGQHAGILDRRLGRKGRGHQERPHVLAAERLDGDAGHDGRVDAAREADAGLAVAVLEEEIAQTAAGRLVDHVGTRDLFRDFEGGVFGFGVVDAEILLEALHEQHQFAAAVHHARRTVVDDFGRAADLVDQHDLLALGEGRMAERLEAVGHAALVVFAGVDRDDELGRVVVVGLETHVVAHDHDALVSLDRHASDAFAARQEAHLAAGRDAFLADAVLHAPLLHDDGGRNGALGRQDGRTDDRGDRVAVGGDALERIFAQFEEGGFPQEIECGRTADGLLGKEDQIGLFVFRSSNGIDHFRAVAFDIADRVVQLGQSNFHRRCIFRPKVWVVKLRKGNDNLEKSETKRC